MAMKTYTQDELTAQPIGYWGAAASRAVVTELRAALAVDRLTQPHWWILNHVAGEPGTWERAGLTARLAPFDEQDTDFAAVFDDLTGRGWLAAAAGGSLTLTEEGQAALARARVRNAAVHERLLRGITPPEYAETITILRRMIDNLGGDSDLP